MDIYIRSLPDRHAGWHLVRGLRPGRKTAGRGYMTVGSRQILVVDDEPQILRGLKVILRDAGYVVQTASTSVPPLRMSRR